MTTDIDAPRAHRELTAAEVSQLKEAFLAMSQAPTARKQMYPEKLKFLQVFAELYNDGVRSRSIGLVLERPYQPKWWKKHARAAGLDLRSERLR